MIITMVMVTLATGKTIYVDDNAAGLNNGSSWENAYNFLQDALANAETAAKPVEIRVAQGTYTPDKGGGKFAEDIYATFNLINGVTISGGYAGLNMPDPNTHDIDLYKTILSGDLNGDDEPAANPYDLFTESEQDSRYDNSYNVVIAINADETAVLDGFTITGGIASFYSYNDIPQKNGGGLYCYKSNPLIANCTFTFNAAYDGGAMYCENSSPTIINCRFEKNAAIPEEESGSYGAYGGNGGGLSNNNSSPVLTSCAFIENHAYTGGGILDINNSNPILADCKFIGNSAKINGGGIENWFNELVLTGCSFEGNSANNGGGMHNLFNKPILTGCTFIGNFAISDGGGISNENSEPDLTSCKFISNEAFEGGAIYNSDCSATLTNCTFTGNTAYEGGAIQNWYGEITIINSLLAGNTAQHGCGMQNFFSDIILSNCTFAQNAIKTYNVEIPGGNDTPGDFIPPPPGAPDDEIPDVNLYQNHYELTNCIIWFDQDAIQIDDNSTVIIRYSNIQGGFDGTGNIYDDPLFANPGYWVDINDPNIIVEPNNPNAIWTDGDYHLKSQAGRYNSNSGSWIIDDITSPCIDAGDPNSPVGDEPESHGGRINMGAYGGTSQASMSVSELNGTETILFQKK